MNKVAVLAIAAACCTVVHAAKVRDAPNGGCKVAAANVDYRLELCGEAGSPMSRLDLRIPVTTNAFKTVVWFHGGGLTKGNRPQSLKINGSIAQVLVGYRLLGKDGLKDGEQCIDDAAAAIAWTLKNIGKYGGDPEKVYVSGMSAGGYLTMMAGMCPKYLGKYGYKPTDLAGIIPVSGQATKHFAVREFSGDKDPMFAPKIDALAPLAWVGKDLPPIFDICGQPPYEWKCRSEENRLLVAACVALGHTNARFVELPLCSHGRVCSPALRYLEMYINGKFDGID